MGIHFILIVGKVEDRRRPKKKNDLLRIYTELSVIKDIINVSKDRTYKYACS